MKKIDDFSTFVSFDLETTGLSDTDKIIEFGAVRVEKYEIKETYQTLINPRTHIPIDVFILTGIKRDEVMDAPNIQDVKDTIIDFIGEFPLVAHNAPFDISFLKREISEILNPVLDTLELSRILLPFANDHRLQTLYSIFEKGEPAFHRALDDAIATSKIYIKLIDLIEKLPLELLEKIVRIQEKIKGDTFKLFRSAFARALSGKGGRDLSYIKEMFPVPNNIFESRAKKNSVKLFPTEECVEKILLNNDTFETAVNKYEKRTEQIELAKMVMKTFLSNEILISEAGTGTGKTFAYLIPSMIWSNVTNERILISTYTKNLEDQLFHKDIINISKGLNVEFKATLIKGRNNYLCMKRWNEIFRDNLQLFNNDEKKSLINLVIWQESTKTGDISENSSFWLHNNISLWSRLSCDTINCDMNNCSEFNKCYLMRIRRESKNSNIVVLNHSLLFSDLTAEQKILGEYNSLIIDEAHNLEKAATDFLGTQVTSWQIKNLLDRLYRHGKGLLIKIINITNILVKKNKNISIEGLSESTADIDESRTILSEITKRIIEETDDSEYKGRIRLKKGDALVEELMPLNEKVYSKLKCTINILHNFIETFEDENNFVTGKEIVDEVTQIYKESTEMVDIFYSCLSCEGNNLCFWAESTDGNENIKLVSVPINIADILEEKLFGNLTVTVLVSATLLVENSFRYFKERVGLMGLGKVREFATGSSFDFDNQVLAILPSFIEEPQNKGFVIDIADLLLKVILSTRRGTLILFTSYKLLNAVYERLVETLHQNNILLLAQGRSGSKNAIIKGFKENKDSVLLGTYSFWEGFDVPGEALENLIITKLPFPPPMEPIIEARSEYAESLGFRPFDSLLVPEAVIKLRQGFGRLIRSKDDKGIVILLDTRLIKRKYGERFLRSLPSHVEIVHYEEDLLERIKNFWQG